MGKSLFTFLSALSLLLALCIAILWPCSWRGTWLGGVGWSHLGAWNEDRAYGIRSDYGWVVLHGPCHPVSPSPRLAPREYWESKSLGVRWIRFYDYAQPFWEFRVRYGTLLVMTLFTPALWLTALPQRIRRHRIRRRLALGLCTNCGYDLTGNVSGICPECGTAISESSTKTASAPKLVQ